MILLLLFVLFTFATAQLFEVGTPLDLPQGQSCLVNLVDDISLFINGDTHLTTYTPPANCSGPWNKVVINAAGNISSNADAAIWIGGVEVLRSAFRSQSNGWDVTKDISSVIPILRATQPVRMSFNAYPDTPATLVSLSATLTFYQATRNNPSANVSDIVIPLNNRDASSTQPVWLTSPSSFNFSIPRNTYKAILEVYASPVVSESEWATQCNDPNNRCNSSCSQHVSIGPYRQLNVDIDAFSAGSIIPAPAFITIVNNSMYPTPAFFNNLNVLPYAFDVTPFVGMLVDGNNHIVKIWVENQCNDWLLDANLYVWLDSRSNQTSGGLNQSTTHPVPPAVNRDEATGTLTSSMTLNLFTSGWVDYSKGRVETNITRALNYTYSYTANTTLVATMEASELYNVKRDFDQSTIENIHSTYSVSMLAYQNRSMVFGRNAMLTTIMPPTLKQPGSVYIEKLDQSWESGAPGIPYLVQVGVNFVDYNGRCYNGGISQLYRETRIYENDTLTDSCS